MKSFFIKNKVLLLGLLGAIAVNVQQFLLLPEPDYQIVAFSGVSAGLSYLGNKLRGQYVTIGATLISLGGLMATTNVVDFNWMQALILSITNGLAVVASPPKPAGYEKTPIIEEAKAEGKAMQKQGDGL